MTTSQPLVHNACCITSHRFHCCIGFDGKNWNHFHGKKHAKVKQRVRKGIPDPVRGLAWQMLAGSRELVQLNPGQLLPNPLDLHCFFLIASACGSCRVYMQQNKAAGN